MSNVERTRNLYVAFNVGDIEEVLAGMNSEVEWREAESNPYQAGGEPWIGPDAVLENLFQRLATEWEGFTATPGSFHDAGDTVVVEGRYAGTFGDTGRSLDAQFCHVLEFEGGQVVRFQQYVDTARFREAMGAG